MRTIRLDEFLTADEIREVAHLWCNDRYHFHNRVLFEVIKPNLERINEALGQENDPDYLAYGVESILMQATREF